MAHVGRNEPCPCGSGKKFKKCHGNLTNLANMAPGALAVSQLAQASLLNLLPGENVRMTVVPIMAVPPDSRDPSGQKGLPGKYQVTLVLSRPGYGLTPERTSSDTTQLEGDSHFSIGRTLEHRITVGTDDNTSIDFLALANKNGFLGKLRSEPFEAQDLVSARRSAYRLMSTVLSNWALQYDIPMYIHQMDTTELLTGTVLRNLTLPHLELATVPRLSPDLEQDLRIYSSMYREALSSNSDVYRFLCLFKMIEAIFARRVRLERKAHREGQVFSRPPEIVPLDPAERAPWLNALYLHPRSWHPQALDVIFVQRSLGRNVACITTEFLRPLRDRVAHALYGRSGELPVYADEALHVDEVAFWLPLTKCIVRRMLKNEFPDAFLASPEK